LEKFVIGRLSFFICHLGDEQEGELIAVIDGLEIPEHELDFAVSRSGGPGGQNVNKVSTRVTLRFNVDSSEVLTSDQRRRIHSRLATRINKEGVLQVTSQRTRSQELNRADTLERFAELLRKALYREPPRIPTRVSRAAKIKRVEEKKKRTEIKVARSRKDWDA
jgi:ribosome-associated protein